MDGPTRVDGAGAGTRPAANVTSVGASGGAVKVCPSCGGEYDGDLRFCPRDGSSLRQREPAADLVGQTIGDRYHVLEKLGEGGMGQVFLVEHVKLRQRRALKVMHKALINDDEAVRRFTGEALKAGQIYHQNVAAVVDCGETADGMAYLVMEYVHGESLTKLLEREGPLAVPRTVGIVAQAAEGLSAAHEMNIVHRDMKPDNIMISVQRDGTELVKVVDFGIAKATQDVSTRVTRPGWVIGTPEYMSPEQASACELDRRSDIYSLALVAFHMLTGKLPFQGATPQAMMLARVTTPPSTLSEVRGDVRWVPGVQAVFDRALARDPDDRFATAREFSLALRGAICEGGPLPPAAPAPPSRRLAAMAGAAALGIALLGAGAYWWTRDPAATARTEVATTEGADPTAVMPPADPPPPGTGTAGNGAVAPVNGGPDRMKQGEAAGHNVTVPPVVRKPDRKPGTTSGTTPGTTPTPRNTAGAGGGETGGGTAGDRGGDLPSDPPPPFDARAALDSLKALTEPNTATEASARRALAMEAALLPRLTSSVDRVEAGLSRLEAYVILNDQTRACALVDRLAVQAVGTSFERAVGAYRESPLLRCGSGY